MSDEQQAERYSPLARDYVDRCVRAERERIKRIIEQHASLHRSGDDEVSAIVLTDLLAAIDGDTNE